ncbi:GerAB/ArcD/ProY family transporter [Sporosarcina sp. E16_8]|uniref:GerAB/ArcD/ProY family transporter n=1 Tax=Sporosarcina sp. E16_8 TaxID=2789295 RepID=UPI001A90EA82|nr:GerAB/ArcD/ProY family transporter [Sporosarcina sp. E16_8]MBO0586361.1 GerAB/ArcD/ProY family transporter [Sporosarcina sp. E16_8]
MTFKLSRNQFFLFLFIAQTGTVFLSFQTPLVSATGPDAWLVFSGVGIFHYILLLLYERNYEYFKPGPFVSWMYKGYWLLIIVSFISYIDYTLAVWAFPETPQIIVISIMVGISLYANLSRAETVINLSVILLPLIPIFYIILFLAWPDFVWTNLFPIAKIDGSDLLKGIIASQFTFIGIELFLFFRKHVDSKQKVSGIPLFIYQMLWMFFFLSSVLFSLLFFSLEELKMIPEPIMYILKSQAVALVERLDLFFIFLWMMWSVITISLFAFTTIYVHQLHAKGHRKRNTIIFHILLVIFPLFLRSKEHVDMIQNSLVYFHLFFVIVVPTVVILMNRRKKK